jgi:hypothetical protein
MRIEKTRMKRRDFLQISGGLSAHVIVGGSLLSIHKAEAQTGLPIAALQALLDPKNDMVLVPADKDFSEYNRSFNKRTQIAPRVRVVAGSAKAVSTTVLWAANNWPRTRSSISRRALMIKAGGAMPSSLKRRMIAMPCMSGSMRSIVITA